jgi:hypothetical protein
VEIGGVLERGLWNGYASVTKEEGRRQEVRRQKEEVRNELTHTIGSS